MKVLITEEQLKNLIVRLKTQINEVDTNVALKNAYKCGYTTLEQYKKNNWKCPSQLLLNAKKCGWSEVKGCESPTSLSCAPIIFKYTASKFRCTPGKKQYLKPDEFTELQKILDKYGVDYDQKKYSDTLKYNIERQDRPDLIQGKDYCKPFCISKEISCFLATIRKNYEKIKTKLSGISDDELLTLTKIAIGLLAWQSNYGKIDRLYDVETKSILGVEINPYDVYTKPVGSSALKQYAKYSNKSEPSFGPAEFQISKYEDTGIEKEFGYGIESVIGSGLAAMVTTWNGYLDAKKIGLSSEQSENEIAKNNGFWKNGIAGTGNHLWDIAISLHSWPKEKMVTKYCETTSQFFAGPCNSDFYEPFQNETKWKEWLNSTPELQQFAKKTKMTYPGKIKVLRNKPILNYFPLLRGAHGDIVGGGVDSKTMVEYVANKIQNYDCVKLTGVKIDTIQPNKSKNYGGSYSV